MAQPVVRQEDAPEAEAGGYSRRQIAAILTGLMLAMLTSMLSTSIVGTALPTIVGELGGQEQLSWVASATLLALTASTPLWGKLSDLYGRKRMFQLSLVIFVLASAGAGFAADMPQLIAARFFQGVGAGGLAALPQIILGDVFTPRERGRYGGVLGSVFAVSTVAGPLLGGFIVDTSWLGWRWCFFITIPLAVIPMVALHFNAHIPNRRNRDARIDWWGATAITGAAAAAMLLLSLGGREFAWVSWPSAALLVLTVALVALAVPAERRASDPILPPRLFRNRSVVLASLGLAVIASAMFGMMIYLPQYLQIVKGLSPTASGLMMVPMVGTVLVTSIGSGVLVSRTGVWKPYPVVGMVLVCASLLLLSTLDTGTSLTLLGSYIAVLGAGIGLTLQILLLAAQNAVERADIAVAVSGASFFRSLGGAMGVAVFGAILTNRLAGELAAGAPPGAAAGGPAVALGSPDAILALPEAVRTLVVGAFSEAMGTLFLAGVPIMLVGLVLVLFVPGTPLKGR
ncbi:MDR family MFS transporter [Allonocardiopsis opalescens]|uniref:EmrB/QacA subfamily drug resistance transporter n=1 Tax=Allonocardiopsis opalescens TaxID=1144618 RepID=A0A2T0QA85_9ACTN|nr:MDR family MFS transporter [Allonocardiopsis opalescens]PRY00798.1 EmrB/QacA subfamily drug resistance transporter [Allonocardiopsis opalescens]